VSRKGASESWPPRHVCFAPRLGGYLARLQQEPLGSLLARPAALGRALRRASELLALTVECLDVPAAWILHSAGFSATVGDDSVALGPAPAELRAPLAAAAEGPLLAVREALRKLPPANPAPATLVALPSPALLAQAAGAGREDWARAVLQAIVRSLGELDVLAGVMFDGDDAVSALGRSLEHYRLTPVCVRRGDDSRPLPPGALAARALIDLSPTHTTPGSELLLTTDGPVSPRVPPEDLLRTSRALLGRQS